VALVRKRTIPTKLPPLVSEVSANVLRVEGVQWSAQRIPTAVNISFLDQSRYFFIQIAPQLSSRGWVDPVPDLLLFRKSGRAGNRTRDLWICSQKLWALDHTDGRRYIAIIPILFNEDISWFSYFFEANARTVPWIRPGLFLSNSLQFIIHYHPIIRRYKAWVNESLNKL
jgi:hypothetical protein